MAASAASASSTTTPSVSSISSRLASKPVSFRTCMTLATKSRCRNWIGDTFTAMRRPGQRWPSRQARRSTHSPSGMTRPRSSAMEMNRAGLMRPCFACGQRTSASSPTMVRPSAEKMGW
jgi:hypothetical protein